MILKICTPRTLGLKIGKTTFFIKKINIIMGGGVTRNAFECYLLIPCWGHTKVAEKIIWGGGHQEYIWLQTTKPVCFFHRMFSDSAHRIDDTRSDSTSILHLYSVSIHTLYEREHTFTARSFFVQIRLIGNICVPCLQSFKLTNESLPKTVKFTFTKIDIHQCVQYGLQ